MGDRIGVTAQAAGTGRPPLAAPAVTVEGSPAQLAKATLRRLAAGQLEPTPENYARAWAQEAGHGAAAAAPPAPGVGVAAWAALIAHLMRGLERGGRQWTAARRKSSLQRVLEGSGAADAQRLHERLSHLASRWEGDTDDPAAETVAGDLDDAVAMAAAPGERRGDAVAGDDWRGLVASLEGTVQAALPGERDAGTRTRRPTGRAGACASTPKAPARRWSPRSSAVCLEARRLLGAAPPIGRRTGRAGARVDRRPDRAGRGRQLGARPGRGDARAPGRGRGRRVTQRAQRACHERPAGADAAPAAALARASATARATR